MPKEMVTRLGFANSAMVRGSANTFMLHNDEILSLILEEYIMEDTITTQLFISLTFSNKGSTAQRLVSGIQLHRANAKERRKTTQISTASAGILDLDRSTRARHRRSVSIPLLPSISRFSSSIAPKKMKALSKNSRGGKRGSSSYSSSASTAAVLIVVSLCLFSVYALTYSSSSSLLSLTQSSTAAEPRFLLKDIPQTGSVPPSEEDSSQNLDDENQEEENGNSGQQESLTKILIEEQSKIRDIDWDLCNVTSGPDYIPCLDNVKAIKKLNSLKHYEHRERHCPEESPTCLVPLPKGYKRSIEWPASRDKIWYNNVPRTKLAEVKGHQNWVKVDREYLIFPGGGTQFIHGALHYIDFIRQSQRYISWGKRIRVVLDVGCGVASFGGYLFERDVLTMSFAPKDEHEAQVQFALERGIPAISAVMGSHRLSFPSNVFDLIHCARCRVPWHADGGMLLLEVNRVLRPGGYFVWSATPVYQKLKEDVGIWKAMTSLTMSMCWDLVTIKKDKLNGIAAAIYRKPTTNECYDKRKNQNPPVCDKGDDPNAAWNVPLKNCMHRVPTNAAERGTKWPVDWPKRLAAPPYWLNASHIGIYGKPAPNDFKSDYEHWKNIVMKSYLNGLGINWSKLRNVMDMRSVYGGFAAALKDLKVWVMNVVNVDSPDTLPVIYERGLFGIYHDWCESFSTYPRTYDLLHADHLFSKLKERCSIVPVVAEIDRITRPGGKLVVKDESVVTSEVESLLKSLHWEVQLTFTKEKEGIITAEKSDWRPKKYSASS